MTVGGVLRVGVTGHRHLAVPTDVEREVDRVLDRLLAEHAPEQLHVVSSLAEGADRLVAERVLARCRSTLQAVLHAVLPLPPDDYDDDFTDPGSRETFARLLDAATTVSLSPAQEGREAAYEHAGREVLARCDVLLALWDGRAARGRGGTGQLVAEARELGRRVEVVHVERAGPVERSRDAPVP